MTKRPVPSAALRLGCRAVDGGPGVELLADLFWFEEEERWVLPLRLRANTPGGAIPEWTSWHVLIDRQYPRGDIDFVPARVGGIEDTYPHQRLNRPGPASRPWRDGRLCLQTGLASLGLRTRDEEPLEPAARLAWYVERAREWLEAAARGELLAPGDAFELPDLLIAEPSQVVFSEEPERLGGWTACPESRGWADLVPVPGSSRLFAVEAFFSFDGRRLFTTDWGDLLRQKSRRRIRVPWLRYDSMPVLPPYAAPTSWPELEEASRRQGRELREELHPFASRLRDGERHLALIGFPIPEKVGAPDIRMHWWSMRLPCFAHGALAPRGYRRNERGYWLYDQANLFQRPHPVSWLRTESWASGDLRSRGMLPGPLRDSRVLLLGAGALGAAMAELLVRGGVSSMVIVDGDSLEAGNLVRHTLGLGDVRQPKSTALAQRLRTLHPGLKVHAIESSLDLEVARGSWPVLQCDTVVDCTASDEVLAILGEVAWTRPCLFFSASFGVGARRLLCFSAMGRSFPTATFWSRAGEWLRREHEELRQTKLPREGLGCWHPVFPARADDVALAAVLAVKALERASVVRPEVRLDVYERDEQEGFFRGVRHVPEQEEPAGPRVSIG